MKPFLFSPVIFSLFMIASSSLPATAADAPKEAVSPTSIVSPAVPFRHVVMFKFKADAKPEQIKEVEQAFLALKGKIPAIQSLEWGINVSTEGKNDGLTHLFFVTFASQDSLVKDYLPVKAHQDFVAILRPILEKAVVLDYAAQ